MTEGNNEQAPLSTGSDLEDKSAATVDAEQPFLGKDVEVSDDVVSGDKSDVSPPSRTRAFLIGFFALLFTLFGLTALAIFLSIAWEKSLKIGEAKQQSSVDPSPTAGECRPALPQPAGYLPDCMRLKDADFGLARAQTVLKEPVVILVSLDGFRWGYQHKVPTPNIDRLRVNGTEARDGLFPVFPSVTFPNHYSIATGLYPPWHGIVANSFPDPKNASRRFSMASHDPDWWLGEPIWETAVKQGVNAATFFWPGSEVVKENWTCPKDFCMHYNGQVPYEQRVDKVLAWLDLPDATRPRLVTLYFEEPDHTGHMVGPDAPQIGAAISRVDSMVGRLLDGLESRGILDDVHIILLGDHGMLGNCLAREVYMEDFKPWVPKISASWFVSYTPLMGIHPPAGEDVKEVHKGLQAALQSNKVKNGGFLQIYLKEEMPERFNYSDSERIQPILGVLAEGYTARLRKPTACTGDCIGSHGYDNALLSMRTIFFAQGPRFARGRQVSAFHNVEVYGIIAEILGLDPAPNNGSSTFPDFMLLSKA